MRSEDLQNLLRQDWVIDYLGVDAVAAHEVAHAVVARHLGWHVDQIILRDAAGPRTEIWPRARLTTEAELHEQLLIAVAGRVADIDRTGDETTPWSAGDIGSVLCLADQISKMANRTSEEVINEAQSTVREVLGQYPERCADLTRSLVASGRLVGADIDDVISTCEEEAGKGSSVNKSRKG